MDNAFSLAGRGALITGGGRGIGRAIAGPRPANSSSEPSAAPAGPSAAASSGRTRTSWRWASPASILTSTLVAVIVEKVAYRPLRGSPRLIPLITSIGVSFFLQNAFLLLFGTQPKTYPDVPDWLKDKVDLGFIEVQGTAEGHAFTEREFNAMIGLARRGIEDIIVAQDEAISAATR